MDRKFEAIDRKSDTINATLLTLTHDVRELKGQASILFNRESQA